MNEILPNTYRVNDVPAELYDGITGEYATPAGYFVDEAEAEEFDKAFPYKENVDAV